jgi:hypothetical protein
MNKLTCCDCQFSTGRNSEAYGPKCDLGFKHDARKQDARECPAFWPKGKGPHEIPDLLSDA